MKLGKTTRMAECRCPFCGHKLDAATPGPGEPLDAVPRPGDYTVCIRCSAILVFEAEPLTVRKATADELQEVAPLLPAQLAQAIVARLQHGQGRRQ